MRIMFGVTACVLLLASCGVIRPLPEMPYRLCPANPPEWKVLSDPPINAAELIAEADTDPISDSERSGSRYFWFYNESDTLLLCRPAMRSRPISSCGSQDWEFNRSEDNWILRDTLGRVRVCGG
jgi:hypothetical protein